MARPDHERMSLRCSYTLPGGLGGVTLGDAAWAMRRVMCALLCRQFGRRRLANSIHPQPRGGEADWFTHSADAVWRIRLGGRGVNLSDAVWRIRFHGARWSILEDLERATTPGEVAYGDRLCSGRPAPAPRGKDGKREYQSGLSSRRRPSSSTAPGSAASAR